MSRPKLFRTPHLFADPAEAVAFFNAERAEGVDPIPSEVAEFLNEVADYDPEALFNVQPGFKTHYVAVAHPDDRHPWLFAKPTGVVFQLGDEQNVADLEELLGRDHRLEETPGRTLPTDIWFAPGELTGPGPSLSLWLSSHWAERQVRSRP